LTRLHIGKGNTLLLDDLHIVPEMIPSLQPGMEEISENKRQLSQYTDKATGWTIGLQFPGETRIFLFATASRPELGPAQPPL
jgi:hypothetical protein